MNQEKIEPHLSAVKDQSEALYRLVRRPVSVHICRSGHVGKTRLCNNLRSYFEGRKEAFNGLKISRLEHKWTAYPVIYLDMAQAVESTPRRVVAALRCLLRPYEELYGLPEQNYVGTILENLVLNARRKTGLSVVVIVDHYDAPLLQAPRECAEEVHRILAEFYGAVHECLYSLRFCFFTGRTRYAALEYSNVLDWTHLEAFAPLFDAPIRAEDLLLPAAPTPPLLPIHAAITAREALPLDPTKRLLIGFVKADNTPYFEDGGVTKLYYTGRTKSFPSTVALNKLYYFMPYIKGKGVRDVYLINVARIGRKSEVHPGADDSPRLVFELEYLESLPEYRPVRLRIFNTYTDTLMGRVLADAGGHVE